MQIGEVLTMAEYIERESAIEEIMSEPPDAHYPQWYAEKIKSIPAADAVPVVRCLECFGRSCWEKDENGCNICWVSGLYVRGEDDYCPYGEREEGDE